MLLHYFDVKKTAAKTHHLLSNVYGDETPSERTFRIWFERFRNCDFDVRDKKRSWTVEKIKKCRAATIASK